MKLQIISKNKGFSLIEVMMVVVILGSLFLLGSLFDQEMYTRKSLTQEKILFISILQKTRNKAMNNIESSNHGLHINNNDFILFYKFPFNKLEITNEYIPRNNKIEIIASPQLLNNNEIEIIFTQLSGEPVNEGAVKLKDQIAEESIFIKNGGLIDW